MPINIASWARRGRSSTLVARIIRRELLVAKGLVWPIIAVVAACGRDVSAPSVNAHRPALIAQASAVVGATAGGFETADSITVRMSDSLNNPVAGEAVTFSIVAGGGTVGAATRNTGADGIARTSWTVGGEGAQVLRASTGSLHVDITATAVRCTELTLAAGEMQSLNPASAACAVLNGTAQRYLVTIVNATNSPAASLGYK